MKVTPTPLDGLLILEPRVFADARGFFMEAWNSRTFAEATGLQVDFVQDNLSRSEAGVLRGLHYQLPGPQGKLVRCAAGAVWDVAVDLRRSSATFTAWYGLRLTVDNHKQLWIPPGFAHGFVALSPVADILYKTTAFYDSQADRAIRWDDPDIGIAWPIEGAPLLSEKDAAAPVLADALLFD